jgi:hypothetical protein
MTETIWLSDKAGNRCSVQYFGSRENAQKALDSLRNCYDCSNCSDCSGCCNCSGCRACSGCSACSACSACRNCHGCSDCSACSHCYLVRERSWLNMGDPHASFPKD